MMEQLTTAQLKRRDDLHTAALILRFEMSHDNRFTDREKLYFARQKRIDALCAETRRKHAKAAHVVRVEKKAAVAKKAVLVPAIVVTEIRAFEDRIVSPMMEPAWDIWAIVNGKPSYWRSLENSHPVDKPKP
jgi:hypothetical protein